MDETNNVNEHKVKNSNWREADPLAIYKLGQGVECQLVVRTGLEPPTYISSLAPLLLNQMLLHWLKLPVEK